MECWSYYQPLVCGAQIHTGNWLIVCHHTDICFVLLMLSTTVWSCLHRLSSCWSNIAAMWTTFGQSPCMFRAIFHYVLRYICDTKDNGGLFQMDSRQKVIERHRTTYFGTVRWRESNLAVPLTTVLFLNLEGLNALIRAWHTGSTCKLLCYYTESSTSPKCMLGRCWRGNSICVFINNNQTFFWRSSYFI